MPNPPLSVAFDTGPLHGAKTGIGLAVEQLRAALVARGDVVLHDYVLSFRARLHPDTVRLPLPASLAHRAWARSDRPMVDRWLPEVDLVHGTNYVAPPSRLPTLISVYDCWFLQHPDDASPTVRRAGEVLRTAIRRGAVVHTSSQATEELVRGLFPGAPVCTVHLGPLPLPTPSAKPPIPSLAGRPYVLSIGTLERRKNLPRLVAAFGRVAAEHADVVLVLAGGGGDDSDAIRHAIDALGPTLAGRVLRTGRIDDAVRSWLLRNAAVLAYPSLDEGFGFPLLDAMQVGTPVVASTAGSIPEVAGDAALLCEPHDIDGLAEALAIALGDTIARERLVAAGHARWRQFDWQHCAEGIVGLYGLAVRGATDELR
jgi:glycosyltransferase involved in cell wall biosynthesis